MTNFYADGRPAEEGGKPLRYDAGGRPHTVGGNGGDPLLVASTADVRRQLDSCRLDRVFLRQTIETVLETAKACPPTVEDYPVWKVLAVVCELALHLTEDPRG